MSTQLSSLREELSVLDEQYAHLATDADDARLTALMSETPIADREHSRAARHADSFARRRVEVTERIAALETELDELLDERQG